MFTKICLSLALLAAMPAWSQVAASATETAGNTVVEEDRMHTPPPVSGAAYPATIGSDARSNYLHAGLVFNTAYNDNVLAGTTTTPVSDVSYYIAPTIAIDQTTSRLHQTLTYSPGFTFYQRTSAKNEEDQNLAFDLQYRLSPHVTAYLRDNFRKSSNVFDQPYSLSGGVVSGSAQSSLVSVVAPFADQLSNTANVELTYQFGRNGMIGASGNFTNLHYPDPSEAPGLSDSSTRGGAAFYSYRLSKTQYLGATYQYSEISGSLPSTQSGSQIGVDSETQTHAALAFYTVYLKPTWSVSLSGGPQHYEVSQSQFPTIRSWTPVATASMGWQGPRTTLAASYSHVVGGGGGLLGAFDSNSANGAFHWQIKRTWALSSGLSYASTKNVSAVMAQANPGGSMITGTVAMQHPISDRFSLEFEYTRLHQSYDTIAVVSNAPNTNRESISISYQLTRPLGR